MTYYTCQDDMSTAYRNYTNLDARYSRGYQPGDRLTVGWSGTVDVADPFAVDQAEVCETVFDRHNRDNRPDGKICPSMSVGDVIVLDDSTCWTVEPIGFRQIFLDPADILDVTYLDAIRTIG